MLNSLCWLQRAHLLTRNVAADSISPSYSGRGNKGRRAQKTYSAVLTKRFRCTSVRYGRLQQYPGVSKKAR
ncbi:hypothetical protein GN244_ATG13193 [Phytophthora infestans]|uniref:Uncharacterized protein n=1 Tax=Phytophthora infestans TaxID=4787 RepID=A0A833S6V9_PHYIN|nr:hypothetical protein GN244_ATG13193 [Phytophthora infestans]